jgi:hypothetical protein
MIRPLAAGAAILIPLLEGACGGEHIAITVSADSEEAIAEAAPSSDYSFLVSAGSAPTHIADLRERDLVVCGSLGQEELVQLMAASDSQGTVLFRSVRHYVINPNVLSGSLTASQTVSVTLPARGEVVFPLEEVIRGRDYSGELLLESCVEDFGGRAVLLLNKDLGVRRPEELLRLVFSR